ncbi:unnamed protein product, partial [marine sediment metagenome]
MMDNLTTIVRKTFQELSGESIKHRVRNVKETFQGLYEGLIKPQVRNVRETFQGLYKEFIKHPIRNLLLSTTLSLSALVAGCGPGQTHPPIAPGGLYVSNIGPQGAWGFADVTSCYGVSHDNGAGLA